MMIATLRAEFRKLFTLRSTYVFIGLAVAFTLFYAGFIEGYQLKGYGLLNKHLFEEDVVGALSSLPMIFGAIICILLMTHEYRYNTIMHTLTASNSRLKVLVAKFIAVSVFALLFTALIGLLSPLASYIGVMLHGNTLVAQQVPVGSLLWRGLLNGWGFLVLSLGLAVLIRNQIGAIISIFVIPTFENVLGLLIKDNIVYLPFTSLNGILSASPRHDISYAHSAVIFGCWLVGVWLVATILFQKRDAN
jgi:ABC-type transport system involved in multi-copper enzyme maturation permease subunit